MYLKYFSKLFSNKKHTVKNINTKVGIKTGILI